MKKIKTIFFSIVIFISLGSTFSYAKCVHEKVVLGEQLIELQKDHNVFIESSDSRFLSATTQDIIENQSYKIQLFPKLKKSTNKLKSKISYNQKYIEYYTYKRIQDYLSQNKEALSRAGLKLRIIGKSIEGRDLYAITTPNLQKKKTILMFGRHHGDEGSANWIIEGFLNEYLANESFRNEYQLLLYPMINPDGAFARSRYNANNRDLNRSWDKAVSKSYDEAGIIHRDLKAAMKIVQKEIVIALDMHGSFTEDFFFRVKKDYVSADFFKKQQSFIDELSIFDKWQNGNFKLSNGHPKMARLVLVNHYKKNALTHESIRNIKKNNPRGRSVETLKDQGLSLVKAIENLY